MTRVVLLANSVTELGGAQRVVHMLAEGLAQRGHDVSVVGIVPSEREHVFNAHPSYRIVTILPELLPPPVPSSRRARLSPSLRRRQERRAVLRRRAIEGIAAELRAGPPGVVIGAQVWAVEHLMQVSRRDVDVRSWGVIAQYHGSFAAAAAGRDLSRILRTCAGVDVFTALTGEDTRAFRAAGMNNVVTMANPLPCWPATPSDGAGERALFLGRLAVEKGPALLLDAWQRMVRDVPTWSLDLIGSGPLRAEITAQAARLPRVRVLPPVLDTQAELMSSGAFVLPSLTEGSPLALVEAMACGVPAVATDCAAGVRELVLDDVTGLLVRSADPGAFARALSRLLQDRSLRTRLAASARARVADRTLETTLDAWEHLFADTLR